MPPRVLLDKKQVPTIVTSESGLIPGENGPPKAPTLQASFQSGEVFGSLPNMFHESNDFSSVTRQKEKTIKESWLLGSENKRSDRPPRPSPPTRDKKGSVLSSNNNGSPVPLPGDNNTFDVQARPVAPPRIKRKAPLPPGMYMMYEPCEQ